jgi:trichothecene 3-O-acetyltransferase
MFNLDIKLNPLTNRLHLGEYYNLSFVYLIESSEPCADFVSHIHHGLTRLSKQFPWVTGQVKYDGYTNQDGNQYSIIPFQAVPRLQVENCQNTSQLDFTDMLGEHFPMVWINGNHIPIYNLSSDSGPFPVMELKFTIEKGAAILTISGHNKAVDMTGLDMIIRMLAKACCGKQFTSLDISAMETHAAYFDHDKNMSRHVRVPVKFVTELLLPQNPPFQASNIKWALFSFEPDALRDIKDLAMSYDSPSQYLVDTDDALTAFVLRNICCARDERVT